MIEANLRDRYHKLIKSVNSITELLNKINTKYFYTIENAHRVQSLLKLRQEKIQKLSELEQLLINRNYGFLNPFTEVQQMKFLRHMQLVELKKQYERKMKHIRAVKEMESRRLEDARKSRIRTEILRKIRNDISVNTRNIEKKIFEEKESRARELEKFKFKSENMKIEQNESFSLERVLEEEPVAFEVCHQPIATYKKRPLPMTFVLFLIALFMGFPKVAFMFLLLNFAVIKMMTKEDFTNDDYQIEICKNNSIVLHEVPARNRQKYGEFTVRFLSLPSQR
jgi:hypothetical protein